MADNIKNLIAEEVKIQIGSLMKSFRAPYHTHNESNLPKIQFSAVTGFPFSYHVVVTPTDGTNVIDVFGSPAPGNFIITSVVSIAKDTTAGNITLKNNGATVSVIAKGTVTGVLVGEDTLANTTVTKGNSLTIESSSAGNSFIIIYFEMI
jgi:hypothetical protein